MMEEALSDGSEDDLVMLVEPVPSATAGVFGEPPPRVAACFFRPAPSPRRQHIVVSLAVSLSDSFVGAECWMALRLFNTLTRSIRHSVAPVVVCDIPASVPMPCPCCH